MSVRSGPVRVTHPLAPEGIPGFAAEPEQGDGLAGVVVVHDRAGLDAAARALSERLAATGLLVLAPDLLARSGAEEPGDPDAVVDLDSAVAQLRDHPRGNGRVGAVGAGWGGRLALVLATSPAAPDRVVDVRGPGMGRRTAVVDGRHPQVVLERVEWLRSPFLGVFAHGDADPGAEDVEELRAALAARRLEHRVVTFEPEDADLVAPARGGGDRASAWTELLGWLEPLR